MALLWRVEHLSSVLDEQAQLIHVLLGHHIEPVDHLVVICVATPRCVEVSQTFQCHELHRREIDRVSKEALLTTVTSSFDTYLLLLLIRDIAERVDDVLGGVLHVSIVVLRVLFNLAKSERYSNR